MTCTPTSKYKLKNINCLSTTLAHVLSTRHYTSKCRAKKYILTLFTWLSALPTPFFCNRDIEISYRNASLLSEFSNRRDFFQKLQEGRNFWIFKWGTRCKRTTSSFENPISGVQYEHPIFKDLLSQNEFFHRHAMLFLNINSVNLLRLIRPHYRWPLSFFGCEVCNYGQTCSSRTHIHFNF